MYRGIVKDRLKTMPDYRTQKYKRYQDAHIAAEALGNRKYGDGDRWELSVEEVVS
jgi:hypothetical protein